MALGTRDSDASALIFWSGNDADLSHHQGIHQAKTSAYQETHGSVNENLAPNGPECHKRVSAYVELFETMIATVVKHENHLLSESEIGTLNKISASSYNARYLLVRLSLRKPNKWHRLSSLNYQSEMGETDRIISAIQELTEHAHSKVETPKKTSDTRKKIIIDLTLDDDDDDVGSPLRDFPADSPQHVLKETSLHSKSILPDGSSDSVDYVASGQLGREANINTLADDESCMSLYELLECLTVEELKGIARQLKLRPSQNRPVLINDILAFSSTQTMIGFPAVNSSKGQHNNHPPTSFLARGDKRRPSNQQGVRLREMIMKIIMKCIRIDINLYKIFKRINLVYFRSTEYTQTLLTPAILTRFRKRYYPFYTYKRTPDIWRTREQLLAYESALELEASISGLIDGTADAKRKEVSVGPTPKPIFPDEPLDVSPPMGRSSEQDKENLKQEDGRDVEQRKPEETDKLQHARTVKDIFEKSVYPAWKELVRGQKVTENSYVPGLERFDCGHVYTRMVHKCARVLGLLKDHQFELEVLENLLAQRWWLRGKRGKWHERRALILMTHCGKGVHVMRNAMGAVVEALEDDDTHLFYRPMLVRRLVRLEKRLQVPPEERHRCDGEIQKSIEVCIKGTRIWKATGTPALDFRVLSSRSSLTPVSLSKAWGPLCPSPAKSERAVAPSSKHSQQMQGKSVWRGRDGEEINVELLALQHYEKQGYKGYHSEGSIIRTLFGLLFFDVIFACVPGAFETPYQSAPLDIAEDSFYFARKDLMEARLAEIEAGAAEKIVARVDEEHRDRNTWCVGVHWDLFRREDLIEITHCFDHKCLSAICRLFCEDYSARGAGLPDLFLWNAKKSICKFVEVKGPGDTLQENQKVWIDFLLRNGMPVEVCHVNETGKLEKKRERKHGAGANTKRRKLGTDPKAEADITVVYD